MILKNFFWWILCVVNGLFLSMGIGLIIIAVLVLNFASENHTLVENGFFTVSGLLLFVGVSVTFIFCFGVIGLVAAKRWMLIAFASMLSILFLMEISAIITAYVLRGRVMDVTVKTIEGSFMNYSNVTENKEIWDRIQTKMMCCGYDNYTDYPEDLKIPVPVSCCKLPNTNCTTTNLTEINQNGCATDLRTEISAYGSSMLKWTTIAGMLHLIFILGACVMARNVGRANYETV